MRTRLAVLSVLFMASTVVVPPADAQTASGARFELGAQVPALRLTDFDATVPGFGGRVSFDLSRWATLEGEVNYYPNDDVQVGSSFQLPELAVAYDRSRTEGLFGVKLGYRGERFGVFAKARPGFARLTDRGVRCVGDDCARVLMLLAVPDYRTEFALDLGGVLEFYPSARVVARLDVGDTMVRHRSTIAPPCPSEGCTSHNLASRFGLGLRF